MTVPNSSWKARDERTKIGEVEAGVGPASSREPSVGKPGVTSLSGEPFTKRGDRAQGVGEGCGRFEFLKIWNQDLPKKNSQVRYAVIYSMLIDSL